MASKSSFKASTNAKNLESGPGEKICLKINGLPYKDLKKKKYKLEFDIKAHVKVGFIPSVSNCKVLGSYVIIQ